MKLVTLKPKLEEWKWYRMVFIPNNKFEYLVDEPIMMQLQS